MEGRPKCDLCVFIAKAMERCVLRHYKNFIAELNMLLLQVSLLHLGQTKDLLLMASRLIVSLTFILCCCFEFLCISDFLRVLC